MDEDKSLTIILGISAVCLMVIMSIMIYSTFFQKSFVATMPKWEYKIVSPEDSLLDAELKIIGENGWDIIFARRAMGKNEEYKYEMLIKRPMAITSK